MKQERFFGGALLLAVGVILSAAAAQTNAPDQWPSWRAPQADPARGKELAQVCLTCHVSNSPQDDPPAPKLHRQRQSYLFFALLEYRDGARKSDIMTPFSAELSDQDARDLAAYLSGEMLDVPPKARVDLPIYEKTAKECIWCHGETGIGEFEGMPVVTGQDPEYLALALREYRTGLRTGEPAMEAVAKNLTDAEIDQLAAYYAAHDWLEHSE